MDIFSPNLYALSIKHKKFDFAIICVSFTFDLFLLLQHIYFQLYGQTLLQLPESNMIRYSQNRYFLLFFTSNLILFILFFINIEKLKSILPLIKWLYPCIFGISVFYLAISNFVGFAVFFMLISTYQHYKNIDDHSHSS